VPVDWREGLLASSMWQRKSFALVSSLILSVFGVLSVFILFIQGMLCGFRLPMSGGDLFDVAADSYSYPADAGCIPWLRLVIRPSWRQRRALRLLGVVFSLVYSGLVGGYKKRMNKSPHPTAISSIVYSGIFLAVDGLGVIFVES